jgi:hypothetical protein
MVVAGDASTSAYRNVKNQLLFRSVNGFSIVAKKKFLHLKSDHSVTVLEKKKKKMYELK